MRESVIENFSYAPELPLNDQFSLCFHAVHMSEMIKIN